ncbi:MAG: hypothetical protein Q9157_006129 [Trypethelium eluteriae]
MIDPITALGLVSNVLQVADYSVRLLSKANEIGRSVDGSIKENRDIEKCAKELILRNQQLSQSLTRNDSDSSDLDNDDVILARLGHDCNGGAMELIECLSSLRSYQGRSAFKSVRQAIKTVYSREKVENMAKRMKSFQEQINSVLLQSMSLRQRLMAAEQTTRFGDLDRGERRILGSVRNLQLLFTSQLNSQTDILMNILTAQHDQTRDLISSLSFANLSLNSAPVEIRESAQDKSQDDGSIHELIEKGSAREIQALLRKRPEVIREADSQGQSPLHLAAKNGLTEIVSYLIRKGADVNAEDDTFSTPLHLAVKANHVLATRLLLQKGADQSAVDVAHSQPIQYSASEEISWVLKYGPELDAKDPAGNSALFNFSVNGDDATVKSLLDQKAAPDQAGACGGLPLMKAAEHGHLFIVGLLYRAGAKDVAIHFIEKGANLDTEDHLGCLPIVKAARNGCVRTVRAILETGKVNVDSANSSSGRTALAEACHHHNTDLVRLLLQYSASPDLGNQRSWTPLHIAAHEGQAQIVELLLAQNGCDVDVKTDEGETPIALAERNGHEQTARLLSDYISKEAFVGIDHCE